MPSPLRAVDAAGDAVRSVIRAFHGSPTPRHFDKFDASMIGTGEGAQAFGYGHYSAQRKAVADEYRRGLSQAKLTQDFLRLLPEDASASDVLERLGSFDARQQEYIRELAANDWFGNARPIDALDSGFGVESLWSGLPSSHRLGTGYELEIQYPESSLLDWDAPISRQPKVIQKAYGESAMDRPGDGGRIYRDIATRHGEALDDDMTGVLAGLEASKELLAEGIPGIRYLDGSSRRTGEATHNYVMFPGTEDQIRILRKYGLIPPTVGAALSQQQQEESKAPGVSTQRQ